MVFIQAIKKKFYLRQIIEGAVASTSTVSSSLLGFQTAINSASFQKGRALISTSGNGQSAAFQMEMVGKEITQESVAGMSEEFFDILDTALATNTSLKDTGNEDDTRAIFAQMKTDDRLYG